MIMTETAKHAQQGQTAALIIGRIMDMVEMIINNLSIRSSRSQTTLRL